VNWCRVNIAASWQIHNVLAFELADKHDDANTPSGCTDDEPPVLPLMVIGPFTNRHGYLYVDLIGKTDQ
jgi:hypothetical protein